MKLKLVPHLQFTKDFKGYEITSEGIKLNFDENIGFSANVPSNTSIDISSGFRPDFVKDGNTLYWSDGQNNKHLLSEDAYGYVNNWRNATDNKTLLLYAEEQSGIIELKLQIFDQETSTLQGFVTSYQTGLVPSEWEDLNAWIYSYDPDGLKFGVEINAENFDTNAYHSDFFNVELNDTSIDISSGFRPDFVKDGNTLYWSDGQNNKHLLSEDAYGYVNNWRNATDNKTLLLYAEEQSGIIELKLQIFDQETSTLQGFVTSYQTGLVPSEWEDLNAWIYSYDPDGLKFGVEINAENFDTNAYHSDFFNVELNDTSIDISSGFRPDFVKDGNTLYWSDGQNNKHLLSEDAYGYVNNWRNATDNKTLLLYAEEQSGIIELKLQIFDQETSTLQGFVTSYQTGLVPSEWEDLNAWIYSYDPDGLKFGVEINAENFDTNAYHSDFFNVDFNEIDSLEPNFPTLNDNAQIKISGLDPNADYSDYISISDTTQGLGVFELGDGDPSQAQWGQAYNSSETVYGSRWDDDIVGGDADQRFITFSGADSIDGSGGSDTLIINGNSTDYSFGLRRGGFSIVDKEGVVKEVKSIEQVQFNDRTLSAAEIDSKLRVPSDTKIYWDIGSRLGNSYFTDDFVLEFEADYSSSTALQKAFNVALKEAGINGGYSFSSAPGDGLFQNGQASYENAISSGSLKIYSGADNNGTAIELPSSDIPPFSKLIEITDAWAQSVIIANDSITIPAGSTSGGVELVASIAENAEIPEYIGIKLKNATDHYASYNSTFYMDTREISTQAELEAYVNGSGFLLMSGLNGSFVGDRVISWDIGSRLGNSYFTDDFVLEFEADYSSSTALQKAFNVALKEAGINGGYSFSSAPGDGLFQNGQASYENAISSGSLKIYSGADNNGTAIELPSSDIPPFSKLIEITDAWAQSVIIANDSITIPAGSTSGGVELVASIAENAEIPEYIGIKLKNATDHYASYNSTFYMDTREISTQAELEAYVNGSGPMMSGLNGSFVSDRVISWDIGSRLGNSYFTDDFVLEFEADYSSSTALQKAFNVALKEAGINGGYSFSSAPGDGLFQNGQASYENAISSGSLKIYSGADNNGTAIELPSSDIPPFSKLIEITDAWAQSVIIANDSITIPAGSTSGGVELVASIAENAEIPEYIGIKLKNATDHYASYNSTFYMDTREISTQAELEAYVNGSGP